MRSCDRCRCCRGLRKEREAPCRSGLAGIIEHRRWAFLQPHSINTLGTISNVHHHQLERTTAPSFQARNPMIVLLEIQAQRDEDVLTLMTAAKELKRKVAKCHHRPRPMMCHPRRNLSPLPKLVFSLVYVFDVRHLCSGYLHSSINAAASASTNQAARACGKIRESRRHPLPRSSFFRGSAHSSIACTLFYPGPWVRLSHAQNVFVLFGKVGGRLNGIYAAR